MTDKNEHGPLFEEMRAEVRRTTVGERQELLLARIDRLEASSRDHSLRARLKALVLEVEEDASELAPFLSRLSSLLP
jgi:hypothetical protein